ncbi:unnamed protein product, partial [Meganyctiphanes norvegica]
AKDYRSPSPKSATKEKSCPKESCGNGGLCRCSICHKNEERIDGRCKRLDLDCICCKPKKPATKHSSSTVEPQGHHMGQNLIDLLNQLDINKGGQNNDGGYNFNSYQKGFQKAKTVARTHSLNNIGPVPECKPPTNNVCQEKGGNCIAIGTLCIGMRTYKYCGRKRTCQCCLPDVSLHDYEYKSLGRSFPNGLFDQNIEPFEAPIESFEDSLEVFDDLVEVDNYVPVNPYFGLTDDTIESIQSIPENRIQSMIVDNAQSMVEDNIESMAAKIQSMATKGFSAITADDSLASDNKDDERVVNIPLNDHNTPLEEETLVETPRYETLDNQAMSNDPLESYYELSNHPAMNKIDYYDSVNIPLNGIEPGLNSNEYYDINDISSIINKNIKDNNDALDDIPATNVDPFQNSNDNFDNVNNVDSPPEEVSTKLEDYYGEGNNIPIIDYYDQVDGNPSVDNPASDLDAIQNAIDTVDYVKDLYNDMNSVEYYDQGDDNPSIVSGEYQSNYGDIYSSIDDDMNIDSSSDDYYSVGENDYYYMGEYQYGAQY